MGRLRGCYLSEFPAGSLFRIVSLERLTAFRASWRFHHSLEAAQLEQAGRVGRVAAVSFYHGGAELYPLEGIGGVWHECCLTAVDGAGGESIA